MRSPIRAKSKENKKHQFRAKIRKLIFFIFGQKLAKLRMEKRNKFQFCKKRSFLSVRAQIG